MIGSARPAACLLSLVPLAGCYSPYLLPSVGFDQTAATLPVHGVEIVAGGGYQLVTSASPGSSREGAELPQGSALAALALGQHVDLLLSAGPGSGEAALKLELPLRAFDLALQPEVGASGNWTWDSVGGLRGSWSGGGGIDVLASGPLSKVLTLYGGLRALGTLATVDQEIVGAGLGVEWRIGPVRLRPELAIGELFGVDGSTEFIAFPHLSVAVRP